MVKNWSNFYNKNIDLLEKYEEKSWLYTTNINDYNNGDVLSSNTQESLNLYKFLKKNIKTVGISRFTICLIKIRLLEKEIFIKNKTIKNNKIDYLVKYIMPWLISSLEIIASIFIGIYA
ncbi:MAG: hypothetical protein CXB60_04705 [Spiroplasma poulsonii]|nr:hypothetical protein [Spiroplasma poulsonii]